MRRVKAECSAVSAAQAAIDRLLESPEPCVRYRALVEVLGKQPSAPGIRRLRREIPASPRIRLLLSERQRDGTISHHPYAKWNGAHWVLAALADLGYPPGDEGLIPLREQVLGWLLSEEHERRIRCIDGRTRRCGSQEGNALHALLSLGLADERAGELAERLMRWQWPDGGWNCDKKAAAVNSSFMETLLPLRALALYARVKRSADAAEAAKRAAEVFLKRRLFKRQRDGAMMHPSFLELHFPCYWHYDILAGLKVMAEAGFLGDKRCNDALDLLESKRLGNGGFPAEGRFYRVSETARSNRSLADWGGVSKRRMNEWVTLDALRALRAAGR